MHNEKRLFLAVLFSFLTVAMSGSAGALPRPISRIHESPKLVRGAVEAGRSVQASIDRLTHELSRGNLNPGIGTKPIGKGISEARARDGARVYFRAASRRNDRNSRKVKQSESVGGNR